MKLKFPDHIVIQNLFEGELAIVNMEISLTTFWAAKGFAADVVRLIQRQISKEDLIRELEKSYLGSQEVLESNLDQILEILSQEKMLLKSSKARASLGAKKVLKKLGPKKKTKSLSSMKKKIAWTLERTSMGSSEVLPAYAICFSDADCGPGQTCVIGADWCLNFCAAS